MEQREYPVYHSYFGGAVGQLLSGQAGVQADQVDGKSMALWFALDRWEDLQTYRDGQADVLLINRYVLSNGVYQSIREIDLGKPDLVDWVFDLEYNHFGLPRADVFVFYDVEPAQAGENVLKKATGTTWATSAGTYTRRPAASSAGPGKNIWKPPPSGRISW